MTNLLDIRLALGESWEGDEELRLWETLIQYLQEKEDAENEWREKLKHNTAFKNLSRE